ncbi:MAG TPA: hypothetical protein VGW11_02945 [Solirubrobacteraceae bacterium]|nr:hypothetical protein [Solirubrobacteraceae bacterium]
MVRRRHSHPVADLHTCTGCGRPLVRLTEVLDTLADGRRLVELSCPECRLCVVAEQDDEALAALENERVDAFVAALHADAILPEDFGP